MSVLGAKGSIHAQHAAEQWQSPGRSCLLEGRMVSPKLAPFDNLRLVHTHRNTLTCTCTHPIPLVVMHKCQPPSHPLLHSPSDATLPREVYDRGSPGFKGRCTAPLLVDKATKRLVSNESASIVRQLVGLDLPGSNSVELYPDHLRPQIDELNDWVRNFVARVDRCTWRSRRMARQLHLLCGCRSSLPLQPTTLSCHCWDGVPASFCLHPASST